MLELRTATPEDRERILAISAQIWDGNDYVADALDAWYDDSAGEIVVVEQEGLLIAFAYRTWILPGHAWLQGIRTDPAHQGQGAGRALTRFLVDRCWALGAKAISVSTYIDNEASIHILESSGFRRVASYVYLQSKGIANTAVRHRAAISAAASDEALAFIGRSRFLEVAHAYVPNEWVFYPFPEAAGRLISDASLRLCTRNEGQIRSLVCATVPRNAANPAFLFFVDGQQDDIAVLLQEAQHRGAFSGWECMVPKWESAEAPALSPMLDLGFTPWQDGREDVFCYRLDRAADSGSDPRGRK